MAKDGKSNRKLPKEAIAKEALESSTSVATTDLERRVFDLPLHKKGEREKGLEKNPYVVLKYFQKDWECFSDWEKDDLKLFSNFLKTLSSHTWQSVYQSAGKAGSKTGLGYTQYEISDMKAGDSHLSYVAKHVSPDIKFFELRVSQGIRVHGFQAAAAFFLVLLDRNHRVFPE